MKGVLIIYAPAIEENVFGAIKRSGVKKYSKFPYLQGVGGSSEPHLDTQVWPGSNSALFIVTDVQTKDKLMGEVRALKREYAEEGIKAFVWDVEEEV
ncbi:MAG: PG0541 family transporter-associated protein [Candidatus Margulisiibacteriota bacterium]